MKFGLFHQVVFIVVEECVKLLFCINTRRDLTLDQTREGEFRIEKNWEERGDITR